MPTISLSNIILNVRSVEKLRVFYGDLLDLQLLDDPTRASQKDATDSNSTLHLGNAKLNDTRKKNIPLLNLLENPNLKSRPPGSAGLYHTAFVYDTQEQLARAVRRVITQMPELYEGSADHLVSEAFYFSDPEGNGVELYYDKPREEWIFDEQGRPKMDSLYLDIERYIAQHSSKDESSDSEESQPAAKPTNAAPSIGHIHLKVGDIAESKRFYLEILNFDLIGELPTALFVSRDNYHHHLGMNTWESLGSEKIEKDGYGLHSFTITFHNKSEFEKVAKNIISARSASASEATNSEDMNLIQLEDPSGIEIRIRLATDDIDITEATDNTDVIE